MPNRKVMNGMICSFLVIVLSLFGCSSTDAQTNAIYQNFTDVHNQFWAKDEVTQLVDMGIINGYPDKQFRPSVEVNRGQAANLLAGALKLPEPAYEPVFKDISNKSSF